MRGVWKMLCAALIEVMLSAGSSATLGAQTPAVERETVHAEKRRSSGCRITACSTSLPSRSIVGQSRSSATRIAAA